MIEVTNLSFTIGNRLLLHSLDLELPNASLVSILGPNGAGKSTLLQLLSGIYQASTGSVRLDGKNIRDYNTVELAKKRAYLHQQNQISGSFTVQDVLEMGRFPYAHGKLNAFDKQVVQAVLDEFALTEMRDKWYQQLSGGEQQRVQFARCFVQLRSQNSSKTDRKILFLDEPLNNLDLKFQFELMQKAAELAKNEGVLVIAVLHDMNMAYQFSDRILLLKKGKLMLNEKTELAMNSNTLSEVYDVEIQKITTNNNLVFFNAMQFEMDQKVKKTASKTLATY